MKEKFILATLTDAQIKHGNLDIDVNNESFFPSDCFGDRSKTKLGKPITLNYGANKVLTDIRIKSGKTISPRKRFGAWLQQSLKANSGDTILITKISEREYTLSFKRQ